MLAGCVQQAASWLGPAWESIQRSGWGSPYHGQEVFQLPGCTQALLLCRADRLLQFAAGDVLVGSCIVWAAGLGCLAAGAITRALLLALCVPPAIQIIAAAGARCITVLVQPALWGSAPGAVGAGNVLPSSTGSTHGASDVQGPGCCVILDAVAASGPGPAPGAPKRSRRLQEGQTAGQRGRQAVAAPGPHLKAGLSIGIGTGHKAVLRAPGTAGAWALAGLACEGPLLCTALVPVLVWHTDGPEDACWVAWGCRKRATRCHGSNCCSLTRTPTSCRLFGTTYSCSIQIKETVGWGACRDEVHEAPLAQNSIQSNFYFGFCWKC